MLRISFYIFFFLLVACQYQQEECCDVDSVANIGWPSGDYTDFSISENSTSNNSGNLTSSTQFDSSTEEMQPVYGDSTIETQPIYNNTTDNQEISNSENVVDNSNNANDVTIDIDNSIIDNTATDNVVAENVLDINDTVSNPVEEIPSQKIEFSVEVISPSKTYVNNIFGYEIKVKNNNSFPIKNGTITHQLPENMTYLSANTAPQVDGKKITWNIDEISPFASRSINVEASGVKEGTAKFVVEASFEGTTKQGQGYTSVDASAGIKINHFDTIDPVEVDTSTIYEIEISNQGNKNAENLRVVDIIPEETTFVNAQVVGVENIGHSVEGKKIIFDVVPSLSPGSKITFKVEVEAIKSGDLLNTVEVTTKGFDKTVTSQEGTKSFQE